MSGRPSWTVVADLGVAGLAAFCAGLVAIYGTWLGSEWRGVGAFIEAVTASLFSVLAYRDWTLR